MPTFGEKTVNLQFDKKTFKQKMTIADVDSPILGWDFIDHYKLDLLWTGGQCVLFNKESKSSYKLTLGKQKVSVNNIRFAPVKVTFAKYYEVSNNHTP